MSAQAKIAMLLWIAGVIGIAIISVWGAVLFVQDRLLKKGEEEDLRRWEAMPITEKQATYAELPAKVIVAEVVETTDPDEDTGVVSLARIFVSQDQEVGLSYVEQLKERLKRQGLYDAPIIAGAPRTLKLPTLPRRKDAVRPKRLNKYKFKNPQQGRKRNRA